MPKGKTFLKGRVLQGMRQREPTNAFRGTDHLPSRHTGQAEKQHAKGV